MLNNTVQITAPQDTLSDKIPADVYQIQLTDVQEREGTDYKTGEPKKQLRFAGNIVTGDEKGKTITFFSSTSWFNGGQNSKPSKLFNLVKNVYAYYHKDIEVKTLPIITVEDVNALIGKQVRVSTEESEKGWPKVTSFMPIKKEYEYKEELSEDIDPANIPL